MLVSVRLLTPRARMLAGTPTAAAMAASLTVTGSGAEDGGGDGGPVVMLLAEPVTLMVMFMVVMAQPSKSLLHPGQGSGSAAGLEQECWLVGTRLTFLKSELCSLSPLPFPRPRADCRPWDPPVCLHTGLWSVPCALQGKDHPGSGAPWPHPRSPADGVSQSGWLGELRLHLGRAGHLSLSSPHCEVTAGSCWTTVFKAGGCPIRQD